MSELEETLSGKELTEWQAFEAIDGPIGNQRADLRSGIVAATVANCHRSSKAAAFKPQDFMPFVERPKQSPEAMAEMLAQAFGVKPKWKDGA